MNAELHYLHTSVIEAVTLLQRDTTLPAGAHHALAVLQAALIHLDYHADDEWMTPTHEDEEVSVEGELEGHSDTDIVDPTLLSARSLADYREERNLHIPAFTALLGITHQEYAHVIHRQPIDRRLRDQIAYKLGVNWREIAEFMPAQPDPWPEVDPKPALEGAPLPPEPWYLVDWMTGRVVSGPHDTPVPANGAYLSDPLMGGPSNLVMLISALGREEEQLPPEGYDSRDLEVMYDDSTAEEAAHARAERAALDELLHEIGDIRLL